MTKAYRIIKWWQRHSHSEQRRSGGRWICCPTSHDSLGYRLLVQDAKGVQTFGVYVALAELAGKLPTATAERTAGILANDQGALEVPALSLLIAQPQKVVGAALDRLQQPDIGWIDRVPTPVIERESSGLPPDDDRNGSDPRVRGREQQQQAEPADSSALQAAAAELLCRAGVPRSRIAAVLETDPDPALIVAHWAEVRADRSVKKPGPALASRFTGTWDGRPKLTPAAVFEAVKAGVVKRVAGVDVTDGKLTQNSGGLYHDGDLLVSASELERTVYG